jgi:hypothetical protein
MCRKLTRLVGLVALLVAAVLLASPAAAAAIGASQAMDVHSVNQCVVIGAINYCFSAKEVYHAVMTLSGVSIDRNNVPSACWTSVDDAAGVIQRDIVSTAC